MEGSLADRNKRPPNLASGLQHGRGHTRLSDVFLETRTFWKHWKEKNFSVHLLTQKSTHWNPRASVRRVTESQPSVPVNLTWI
jgi:hypothetical protein